MPCGRIECWLAGGMSLLTITLATGVSAAEKVPSPEQKRLDVYATSAPPVIDGKMDDPCWKDTAVTDRFHVFKTGAEPKEATEARVTYDAENLYVFITCHESQLDQIRATRPQDQPDENVFNDDSVEIFLEPVPPTAEEGVNHFQLAINSLGTRFDMAHPANKWDASSFTGVWQVKTARQEKAWTAEFAIAFHSLTHSNEYRGTPAPGDVWRANFCRSEQRLPEWSTWAFQDMGFHDRGKFGHMAFHGCRDAKAPTVKIESAGALRLGPSALKGTIENPSKTAAELVARLTLGKAAREVKLSVPAEGSKAFEIPYLVDQGGEYRLFLSLIENGKTISMGSVPFDTPKLDAMLQRIRQDMDTLSAPLKAFPDLAPRQSDLDGKAKALEARFARRENLPADAWGALEKDTLSLEEAAAAFRRDVSKAMLRRSGQAVLADAPLGLTIASPFEKIRPGDTFLSTSNEAGLEAARRESESFQIVLQAFDAPVEGLTIKAGDFVSEDGKAKIAGANIRWGAVGMIKRKLPKAGDGTVSFTYDPDPIMEGKPFRLEANELRPVWIDVSVPDQAAAGTYKGACAVALKDGREMPVKVTLRVFEFTLPEKSTLRVENWYSPTSVIYYYRMQDLPLEQFERHAAMLERYRHPCFPYSWQFMPKKILIIEEPDGRLTFDFTELNKYLEISHRRGCRLGNIQMSAILGWVQALTGTFGRPYFKILDRRTGVVRDYPGSNDKKLPYDDTARSYLHCELLKALWLNVKAHGWEDMVYSEHEDEPNDPTRFDRYRRMAVLIRELCPGIKSTSWGVSPDDRRGTIGYSNCWGPVIGHVTDAMPAIRGRRALGEETWVYTCGPSLRNPVTGWEVFDGQTDSDMIKTRIGPWTCWRLDLQGIFHFAINCWDGAMLKGAAWNGEKIPEAQQFHMVELPQFGTGNGMYAYPAPDGSLWPSLRLCAMRDGLEDYEYLAALRGQLDRLAIRDPANPLLAKHAKLLELDPEIVKSAGLWTHDPKVLSQRRREVANAIEELNPVLWKLSPPLVGAPGEELRKEK